MINDEWSIVEHPTQSVSCVFTVIYWRQRVEMEGTPICFMLITTLVVYGRDIFIYLHLSLLRTENIQFDIFAQDYGVN